MTSQPRGDSRQDQLYEEAAATYGAALERLARAYESDADRRLDLLQEIHVALWRSFAAFDGRCSLRTWVYRVAHNVATSQVIRRRGRTPTLVGLDELESMPDSVDPEQTLDDQRALDRMMTLIHALDADRSAGDPSLPRRDGCGVHRRDRRHLAGQRGDEDPSRQEMLARRFHEGTP